ncbi:polysaccharide biosynthesis tyrosine autokinase [Deinococcus humi]|uniref:Non-specific protein-tyrosine kinase n=1 Tax=Deinococcus humi TaxID=662880 RepID=A0A7W8JQT4_9DEIO|nr:CpsD/CapB family tyrosine-protein kinase [Deinococcus humi]MBB5361429.1 non-specific protein-tyrosine kinase [Deinococcus humi]GGO20033.1 exoP [Deinococcus humi]
MQGIRRRLPWILGATVLVTVGVYVWSKTQPDVYEASSSLVTAGSANTGTLGDSLVTASALPQGALQEALQGPIVLGEIIRRVGAVPTIAPEVRRELSRDLQEQLQKRKLTSVELQPRLDPGGNGIYTVTAQAPTPQAAATLTDLSVEALLNWDRGRALSGIERAERGLRAQLVEIDRQLAQGGLPALERQTLVAARASAQRSLAQAGIQAQAATGFLELVAPAVVPLDRVAPKPTRNAVLAGLLTLLLGLGLAALRTVTDRTARSEDDLLTFGLPTLGSIPRLRRRDIVFSGIVRAAREAGLYEAVGFLRVNLLTRIGERPGQCIMVTSTVPGEGKSSLTATLADGLATSGKRVLIIDADMRRGTQQDVWDKYQRDHQWSQLVGVGGARTLQEALLDPSNVQVMQAEPNLHLLPAGPGMHDSLGRLNRADLGGRLAEWGRGYDLILIDSPPLLALADALVLGRHVDHVLLVVEEGKTSLQAVKQSVRRAQGANLDILGFVLNKVTATSESRSYSYDYAPRLRE